MTQEAIRGKLVKRPFPNAMLEVSSPHVNSKKRRTKQDFVDFCNIVLEYTQYESLRQVDARSGDNQSPLGSLSSSDLGSSPQSPCDQQKPATDVDSGDDDAYSSVSCFCGKPFAKRPMIECSNCMTWVHLSCAKIRRTHIPETFLCPLCRQTDRRARKSGRVRTERRIESA